MKKANEKISLLFLKTTEKESISQHNFERFLEKNQNMHPRLNPRSASALIINERKPCVQFYLSSNCELPHLSIMKSQSVLQRLCNKQ